MNNILESNIVASLALSVISSTAYATNSGFYVGMQGGYADTGGINQNTFPSSSNAMNAINHALIDDNNMNDPIDIWDSSLTPTSSSVSSSTSNGFAGRLFGGYQFNPYFAIETGFIYLSSENTSQETVTGSGKVTQPGFLALFPTTSPATASISFTNKLTEKAVDLAAKFSYPIQNTGVSPYAKVGMALVIPDLSTTVNNVSVNIQGVDSSLVNVNQNKIANSIEDKSISSALCPEGALGINYDINQNLSLDTSWTFIKGEGDIENINFASLGLIVHFA